MCNDLWTSDSEHWTLICCGWIKDKKTQLHPEYCNILPYFLLVTTGRLRGCLSLISEEFKFIAQHEIRNYKIKPGGDFTEENTTTERKHSCFAQVFLKAVKHKNKPVKLKLPSFLAHKVKYKVYFSLLNKSSSVISVFLTLQSTTLSLKSSDELNLACWKFPLDWKVIMKLHPIRWSHTTTSRWR